MFLKLLVSFLMIVFSSNLWAKEKVLLGIDVLVQENFKSLQGKKIGLITNHTGLDKKGRRTIDLLAQAPHLNLVSIFTPEHGLAGNTAHGLSIEDSKDIKTGIPVYSLYGKYKRPTPQMLEGLDTLVFDIQDIGARFYTYTTTLAYLLEEAAKRNMEFFVLDRPNPITGSFVEGEPLDPAIQHFTAYLQIPVRHGLTVGEIANWYNHTAKLNAKLKVIKMKGWKRSFWWDQTDLKFVATSPNIPNPETALLYCGIGALEATNISVGRGTRKPFYKIGAPWINGEDLAERLSFYSPPGFDFKPARFTPKEELYKGEKCYGISIKVTNRELARPVDLFITLVTLLRDQYPNQFEMRWDEIERVTGSPDTTQKIQTGASAETILFILHEKAKDFTLQNKPYLLYE